jgi:hypothetical protein
MQIPKYLATGLYRPSVTYRLPAEAWTQGLKCKTNTLTVLKHQMRISITQVSSKNSMGVSTCIHVANVPEIKINFPYRCSNISALAAYGVYILLLIRYARACSTYDQLFVRGILLTNELMLQGFQQSCLQAAFRKRYGRYNHLIYPYNLFCRPHTV